VFEKFKSVLSVWKMRNLTLYGKVQVVRSLAMSQLLYVYSKIPVPKTFTSKVEKEIVRFIWHGRKPKIKYRTLIGDLDKGGIRLPDLETIIQTNRVGWALKMMENTSCYWKCFAKRIFKTVGGLDILGENFDLSRINLKNIPTFYKEILNSWCNISATKVESVADILQQPIWMNRYIHLKLEYINVRKFVDKGILILNNVWDKKGDPNWDDIKAKGKWSDGEYMTWRSIIDALPADWKYKLKRSFFPDVKSQDKYIEISNSIIPVSKIQTKMIYWEFIEDKFKNPTSQKYFLNKLSIQDIEWLSIYQRVYSLTNNIRLWAFQYKILNNCLFFNKELYKFKIVESPNCTFCKQSIESIEHFFVECVYSKTFYTNVKDWLKGANIKLPDLKLKNIITGENNDIMEGFLFLIYKYVLFNARSKKRLPELRNYQMTLLEYEKIEYITAKKNSKTYTHLKKYEKLQKILRDITT